MLSDSILANAGWLFFAAYSAIVAAVSFAAFGRDVLPAKANGDARYKNGSADPVQPAAPRQETPSWEAATKTRTKRLTALSDLFSYL